MIPRTPTSHLIPLLLLAVITASTSALPDIAPKRQATTLISVTTTTTIRESPTPTASNSGSGPCDNFYGACVVYSGQGQAAYTTTVYASQPAQAHTKTHTTPSTTFTSTTTLVATTTVTDGDACRDYEGACVVYGSGGGGAETTVWDGQATATAAAGHGGHDGQGNSGGFIGSSEDGGGDGAIGTSTAAAGGLEVTWMLLGLGMLGVGFVV